MPCKKVNGRGVILELRERIKVESGTILRTTLPGVSLKVNKISDLGGRILGTFSRKSNVEVGSKFRILGVRKKRNTVQNKGFLTGKTIYLYGSYVLPTSMDAGAANFDVDGSIGGGLELKIPLSFISGARFGIGIGGEVYLPQTAVSGEQSYADMLLASHLFVNARYKIINKSSFNWELFGGFVYSSQFFEHDLLENEEMSNSFGIQLGSSFSFNQFFLLLIYRAQNYEYKTQVSANDVSLGNLSLGFGLTF